MKKVKIILAVAVISTISFFLWKWSNPIHNPPVIPPPSDTVFTNMVKKEIDLLRKAPVNVFSNNIYGNIKYLIKDFHEKNFFSKNETDNNQWREILSQDLYSAYAPKFVDQALNVFKGPEWKITDLNFIRSEVNTLQNSKYLQQGTPVDDSFKNIRTILSKYDDISEFISSCNNFPYPDFSFGSSFPLNDVRIRIQKSKTYLSNGLDNSYVNSCIRLKDGLREIPQILFDKHISYLRTKINTNSGRYVEFKFQKKYSDSIFSPLKNQVDELDNNIYGVSDSTFNSDYKRLIDLLNVDNKRAADYFN